MVMRPLTYARALGLSPSRISADGWRRGHGEVVEAVGGGELCGCHRDETFDVLAGAGAESVEDLAARWRRGHGDVSKP